MSEAHDGAAAPPPAAAPTPEPSSAPSQNKQAGSRPKKEGKQAGGGGGAAGAKAEKKPDGAEGGAPKLSGAELKAKAKAEKAARRQQAKQDPAAGGAPADKASQQKGKGKADDKQAQGGAAKSDKPQRRPSSAAAQKPGAKKAVVAEQVVPAGPVTPPCFAHLAIPGRLPMSQARTVIHPAILVVGQRMATFATHESIPRLEAMLLAFKEVKKNPSSTLSSCANTRILLTLIPPPSPSAAGDQRLCCP